MSDVSNLRERLSTLASYDQLDTLVVSVDLAVDEVEEWLSEIGGLRFAHLESPELAECRDVHTGDVDAYERRLAGTYRPRDEAAL